MWPIASITLSLQREKLTTAGAGPPLVCPCLCADACSRPSYKYDLMIVLCHNFAFHCFQLILLYCIVSYCIVTLQSHLSVNATFNLFNLYFCTFVKTHLNSLSHISFLLANTIASGFARPTFHCRVTWLEKSLNLYIEVTECVRGAKSIWGCVRARWTFSEV